MEQHPLVSRGGTGQRKKEAGSLGAMLMVETISGSRRLEVGTEEVMV